MILYFDEDKNIIAKCKETPTEINLMNVESTLTSRLQMMTYFENTMRTMDYG